VKKGTAEFLSREGSPVLCESVFGLIVPDWTAKKYLHLMRNLKNFEILKHYVGNTLKPYNYLLISLCTNLNIWYLSKPFVSV
jgi:hypothetical protein